jgi:WD40 repeat protein/tRNA A-37 threonylcarbamoyl transferase component Bud32
MSDLPTTDWTRINDVADRFERAWKTGSRPRIEDFLAEAEPGLREAFLEELLRVELELRRRAGEDPTAEEYRERFPEQGAVVEAAFAPVTSESGGTESTTAHRETTEDTDPALEFGTRVRYFGDYELSRELGRGGMGVVYKARQISLNRPVALKMIRSAALASEDERRRFQNEAEAIALLDHPHIVPILEVGCHDDQPYFSMKLIGGPSLDKKLDEYANNPKAAARLVKTAAEAVHHAHQRGILHRDLKPANIVLDDRGEPHVTDFGLAKRVEGDSELTHSGAIMGTPAYMAPEQASGRRGAVTTASDVYGLGAILYATLTGRAPFGGESAEETLAQVRESLPTPPTRLRPQVPHDLEVICLKCLEKEPSRRYASARDLADDLLRYLRGEPILARPVGKAQRAWMWCRRNKAISALAALLVASMVLGTAGSLRFALKARDESQKAGAAAGLAEDRLRDVESARSKERVQAELDQRQLYDSQMNIVQRNWEVQNPEVCRRLLDAQTPSDPGRKDLRGFEWFYWQRKLASELVLVPTGPSLSTACSPDFERIASIDYNGTMTVRDSQTGRGVFSLNGHGKGHTHPFIRRPIYSPDGKRIAFPRYDQIREQNTETDKNDDTISADIQICSAETGQDVLTLKLRGNAVTGMAFSRDGTQLASLCDSGTIQVWNTDDGRERLTFDAWLKGELRFSQEVVFSNDGKRLISTAAGSYKILSLETGREIKKYQLEVWKISPDGRRLVAENGKNPLVFEVETGNQVFKTEGHLDGYGRGAEFSRDGSKIASFGDDGIVKVWDAQTGRAIATLKSPQLVMGVLFSPHGEWIASTGSAGTTVWDTTTWRERRRFNTSAVAFSPDGKQLACTSSTSVRIWSLLADQDPTSVSPAGGTQVWDGGRNSPTASAGIRLRQVPWSKEKTAPLEARRNRIFSVATYSPDGGKIASTSLEGAVLMWDVATRRVQELAKPEDAYYNVAFSPDAQRLAAGGSRGLVTIWDTRSGKELLDLKGHESSVFGVAFSPDGRTLATAGADAMVRIWDALTGRTIRTLHRHRDVVWWVAFSPDGRRLASANEDGTVSLWDVSSGRETLILPGQAGGVRCLAFSPDGKTLAGAITSGGVKTWDVETGQERRSWVQESGAHTVAYSPDGKWIVTACADGVVRTYDVVTGGPGPAEWLATHVFSACYGPDGKRVALACADGTVRTWDWEKRAWAILPVEEFESSVGVWDARTGQRTSRLLGPTGTVHAVAYSPDGSRLAAGDDDGNFIVWDLASGKAIITCKGYGGPVKAAAFSLDAKRIAFAACTDRTNLPDSDQVDVVKVLDVATAREILILKGHEDDVLGIAFSPDGGRIVTASFDGKVKVWDAASGRELLTLDQHETSVAGVAFSPDGRQIASASDDGTVRVWDAASGRESLAFHAHQDGVCRVVFSPDGKRIATASPDGTVTVWDSATGKPGLTFPLNNGLIWGVAFSADGKLLASTGGGTVVVPNVQTGELGRFPEQGTLTGHVGTVNIVVYSPDGTRVATGGGDSRVIVWDRATGKSIVKYEGHAGPSDRQASQDLEPVQAMAFSPDGRRIASASFSTRRHPAGTVVVWDVATAEDVVAFKGHEGEIRGIAFSPDGKRFATASLDHKVKIWDVASSGKLLSFDEHADGVEAVAFSPDGKRVASASDDGKVKVWDAASARTLVTFDEVEVRGIAFSPDGKRIATASIDGTIKFWDATTGKPQMTLPISIGPLLGVAFSRDGKLLASAGGGRAVVSKQHATSVMGGKGSGGKVVPSGRAFLPIGLAQHTGWQRPEPDSGPVLCVAWSPDGTRLAAGLEGKVEVWDLESGVETLRMERSSGVADLAFSPHGRQLAAGLSARLQMEGNSGVAGLAFSPDGRGIAAGLGGRVWVRDDSSGFERPDVKIRYGIFDSRLARSPIESPHKPMAPGDTPGNDAGFDPDFSPTHSLSPQRRVLSPDGKRLLIGRRLWDAELGHLVRVLGSSGTFSPDGRRIACPGSDGTVDLYATESGEAVLTLRGHLGEITGVWFSPDSKRIASAGTDRTIRLWDVETGRTTQTLGIDLVKEFARFGPDFRVSFSPDSRRIAAAGREGSVKVWDAETGRPLLSATIKLNPNEDALRRYKGQMIFQFTFVGFSPEGSCLVAGMSQGSGGSSGFGRWVGGGLTFYRVWDIESGREAFAVNGSGLAFSLNGRWIATFGGGDGTVTVRDAETGSLLLSFPAPEGVPIGSAGGRGSGPRRPWGQVTPTFSPDSRFLAAANSDGSVTLWDIEHRRSAHGLLVQDCLDMSLSPDGQRVAILSGDGTIRLWDVVTGSEVLSLAVERLDQSNTSRVSLPKMRLLPSWVDFSPDGKQLACEGPTGALLWDATPVEARRERSAISPN